MARTTKPLTDTGISNAKPKARAYEPADGDGLMLRVATSGAKTWLFTYYKPYSNEVMAFATNVGIIQHNPLSNCNLGFSIKCLRGDWQG